MKTSADTCDSTSDLEKFKALTSRLFAVPKEEYDKEAAAVEAGKPVKTSLSKPRGKH